MENDKIFSSLVNEIRVNNAVVVIGAGISFEPGMPLYSQLAPTVWEVVSSFPDIDDKFQGSGSTKSRIGEDLEKLRKAFAYIERNEEALYQFKRIFKKINDKIAVAPDIHKNISELIHENYFELIVSLNWDSLLEMSWAELYGTNINSNKKNLIKPHGDVLKLDESWILPNSPGRISKKEKDYINLLANERPRTLIIVGYSESDAKIVEELIAPFEERWKVYRVSPFSKNADVIRYSAKVFFERLVEELISPDTYNNWEFLNFQNQNQSLARAILGYKLTPQDVNICPKLPQVQKAIKILDLNNFVIIQGKPGSGKSISCYQIAHHYLKQGYEVIRFKTESFVGADKLDIPYNSKAIYIIDDGQILPSSYLLKLQEKSSKNQKIILTITDDIDIDSAIISISNIENIECISKFYLRNKKAVIDIVSRIDKDVGDYFMQVSLEERIKIASKQENLWKFNYILRGGWKTTKEDYYQSKELDNSQTLIFLLSLKQIITKDSVVELKWMKQKVYEHFSNDEDWTEESIRKLRNKRLIDSSNLRMIHYEAAKRQLLFIFESDKEHREIYEDIIRDELLSNKNSTLGKVWFLNAIFSSIMMGRITSFISTDEFYNIIEENIELNNQTINMHTLFLMDVLERATDNRYFDIHYFSAWIIDQIENVTDNNAYSLSSVVNELFNSERKKAKRIGRKINLKNVTDRVSNFDKNYLYQWSRFISRLGLLLNKEEIVEFIELIDKSKVEKELLSLQYNNLNFESLVEFLVTIFNYDRTYGIKIFHLMSEYFRIAFKENSIIAWHTLGFSFVAMIMGFNSLSDKRIYIKKDQRIIAESIINFIDAEQFAEELVNAPFRKWHNLSGLYHIIRNIDSSKYAQLVESVDLECIKQKFDENNVWENFNSEIIEFLFLYLDKKYISIIDNFILDNKDKLIEKNIYQFAFSPSLIKYYLDNNLHIPMYRANYSKDSFEWQALEIIIYILAAEDDPLLQKFLSKIQEEIADAITNFGEIDLVSINNVLKFINYFDANIFNDIKGIIDPGVLNKKVEKYNNKEVYSGAHAKEIKLNLNLLIGQLGLSKIDIES